MKNFNIIEEEEEGSADLGESGEDEGFMVMYEMGTIEVGQEGVNVAEKKKAAASNYEGVAKQLKVVQLGGEKRR